MNATGHTPSWDATLSSAIASLLDVVEEMAQGLAHGQTPEKEWADVVTDTFEKHRREMRGEEVEWPSESS